MFILQDKNTPEKTQNVKRYDLGDGRSIVAIFRVIDNGQRIISFHGFEPRHSRIKQYRVAYADDAIRAGTSPATPESGQAAQVPNSIPQSGAPAQGASPDVRTEFGRSRFSVDQSRLKPATQEEFDRAYETVRAYFNSREEAQG